MKLKHSMVAMAKMEYQKNDQPVVGAEAPLLYLPEQNRLVPVEEEVVEGARLTPLFQHAEEVVAKAHQMQLDFCFASFYAFRVYLRGSRESVEPGDESPIRLKLVFSSATAVVFAERDSYLSFQYHRLL
jgi:hypothetical protein